QRRLSEPHGPRARRDDPLRRRPLDRDRDDAVRRQPLVPHLVGQDPPRARLRADAHDRGRRARPRRRLQAGQDSEPDERHPLLQHQDDAGAALEVAMCAVLVDATLVFTVCLALHIAVWRIRRPLKYAQWLPLLSLLFLIVGPALAWMLSTRAAVEA